MSLAAEIGDWPNVVKKSQYLIRNGEHDAVLYLLLDKALSEERHDVKERLRWLRESTEQWNRKDMASLVRVGELLLYCEEWEAATQALNRADDIGKEIISFSQRERIQGVIKAGNPYAEAERRFEGNILRLTKPYEGILSLPGGLQNVFFRSGRDLTGSITAGDRVSYSLAWRIRGLRAVGGAGAEPQERVPPFPTVALSRPCSSMRHFQPRSGSSFSTEGLPRSHQDDEPRTPSCGSIWGGCILDDK
jgi:hypothetical protein